MTARRIDYAGSVHDEREIDAVVDVLRGGPQALRIGKNVRAFEAGHRRALRQAPGRHVQLGLVGAVPRGRAARPRSRATRSSRPPVTFSTDIAPIVRAGLVPVFVDVEPDTYNVDVDAIEAMIGPRTRAILVPNLIGNVPDWDRIRAIADAHDLQVDRGLVRRARLDAARHADRHPLRHLGHVVRAVAHHHRGRAPAGWCASTTTTLVDRCLLLRRWGRRSETQIYGSRKGVDRRFFSSIDGDLEYDNLFIFDELGWNFEPSELSAAFGLVQLEKLADNLAQRKHNFARLMRAASRNGPTCSCSPAPPPRSTPRGTCSRC